MPRPVKNSCDYFSHDADMRNHRKIKALRKNFEHGYAIWCMFLEHLTASEGNVFEYNEFEIELLSGDFNYTSEEITNVIEFCLKMKLLNKKGTLVHSHSLDERLHHVYHKRERQRQEAKDRVRVKGKFANHNTNSSGDLVDDNNQSSGVIADENTTKESKVKESKVKLDSNSSKSNLDSKNSAAAKETLEIQAAAAMLRFNKDLPQDYVEAQVHELLTKYQGKEIKDIDRLAIEWIKNEKPKSKTSTKNQKEPEVIQINGKNHKPKLNGAGWVYPTIVGKCFDESFTEVLLADGTWQELNASDSRRARSGTLDASQIWKGKK